MAEKPFTGLTASLKIGSAEQKQVLAYVSGVDLTLEKEIIEILAFGMTYKEMAQKLDVSTDCIKAHISSMLSKTGFSSKTKLAAVVISKRLIVNGF